MRSRRVHDLLVGRRALLLAVALAQCVGCASWNPFAGVTDDPMRAELRRLEKEQRRIAAQERAAHDAETREREENPKTMEERILTGDQHLAGGQMAAALWEYAAAHRIEPDSPEPRSRLGYVHLRHDPGRAQPLFESALVLDEDHVSSHIGLGLALLSTGDRPAGIDHLERAVMLAPESAKAHAALGVSLDQMGRSEEALQELERAHALRPRDSRIMNNLGVAHLRSGAPKRAEPLFRAALRQDDRDEELRANNLGMALGMQGRFEEALEAFRRVGDEQSARANLGYVHYSRGEHERAILEYERALVAGGDASVDVVRNLEAARNALQAAGREVPAAPNASKVAGPRAPAEGAPAPEATAGGPSAPGAGGGETDVVHEPASKAAEDPWLRKEAPPGDLAE